MGFHHPNMKVIYVWVLIHILTYDHTNVLPILSFHFPLVLQAFCVFMNRSAP